MKEGFAEIELIAVLVTAVVEELGLGVMLLRGELQWRHYHEELAGKHL